METDRLMSICAVGDIPQGEDNNQSPPVVPEQEICGDGQDNDGNGQIDENCNVGDVLTRRR